VTAAGRIGALALIGLLAFGTWLSVREGVVAVLWKGVSSHPEQWKDEPEALLKDRWTRSREFVEQALNWDPEDPQLLQTAGLLYWWGAWANRDGPEYYESLTSRSLELHRRAIRMRPASPGAWMDLAAVKNWHGEWDDEFQYAYAMAWKNGGWSRSIIFSAAEIGFDAWKELTPENRERFYQALARAELRGRGRLQLAAREAGKVFVLCLALHESRAMRDWCIKQGYRLPPPK
jgi:hypothetical protein